MRKRGKVTRLSHRDEADFYRVNIMFSANTIKEDLKRLYDMAIYNAEMADPLARELEADDLRRNAEYILEQIETDVEEITRLVR